MNFSSEYFLRRLFLAALLFFFFGSFLPVQAQQKYWVVLKDKKGVSFDPYQYFDAKALERRQRQNLPIYDETDKPINATYRQQITALSDSVSGESRWLNAIACFAQPTQLEKLRKLAFVREIIPFQVQPVVLAEVPDKYKVTLKADELKILQDQTASLGASVFREKNLNGKGIRIAILDAGFKGVDNTAAFEHLYKGKQVIKTWDFVKRREYVYDFATHGTLVLSCVAGRLNGHDIGLATGAEFLLARTERMYSERFSEEENWLAAMEWADKNGADIINSSLGYTNDRYFREQMNGRYAFVARAANLAARKGILVVNANGNDGTADWKILGTPADADSVLAVGGIDPKGLFHVNFSSYGPTADKRMKPNVSAFGIVVGAGPKGFEQTQGTSFSSPLVAGFAACAWQANRALTNMQLFKEIEKSGNLYPYFDYAHGFGMPQAQFLLNGRATEIKPTIKFETGKDQVMIVVKTEFMPDTTGPFVADTTGSGKKGTYLVKEKHPSANYVYYHIANPKGSLDRYYVIEVEDDPEVAAIKFEALRTGSVIRVFYKGYTGFYAH
ncbi:S8 family serine peptidase [Adhaeribacter sp. BT258]|uniref:S8 family serine peptidase n=1 Tax=Adhaeribacter terrigena TaxID=2793070 RepID=A0ABS1BYN4_9BACT|nr:S8 family serine peptidase [Adhaeribacter terrigena]MBK0402280.1 S8 family serine peptidase [Adhaeribacter terrigena]